MIFFAMASLTPICLALIAASGQDWAAYFGLVYISLGVAIGDLLVPFRSDRVALRRTGGALSELLAVLHIGLLWAGIWGLSGQSGLGFAARWALFGQIVLIFGQISASNAHELIHRTARLPRWMGIVVYSSLLFGHHATAHPAIHHRFVATARDPNSPAPGQSLYGFLRQAWVGSFLRGLEVETHRLRQSERGAGSTRNPYWAYAGLAVLSLAISVTLGGWLGLVAHLGLAWGAITQLLTSDYVQHYGLRRRQFPDGRYEPVGPHHSWNAPTSLSRRMMLNAPLHSEHHMRPGAAYPSLSRTDAPIGPVLPYSLPIMASLALVPRLYRKIMTRELGKLAPLPPLEQPGKAEPPRNDVTFAPTPPAAALSG